MGVLHRSPMGEHQMTTQYVLGLREQTGTGHPPSPEPFKSEPVLIQPSF